MSIILTGTIDDVKSIDKNNDKLCTNGGKIVAIMQNMVL